MFDSQTSDAYDSLFYSARDLVALAGGHLSDGSDRTAWGLYYAALSRMMFVYEDIGDEASLKTQARTVYEETRDTLVGGQRRAVLALLTEDGTLKNQPRANELSEVYRILNDHKQRQFLLSEIHSHFNRIAVGFALLTVAGIFGLIVTGDARTFPFSTATAIDTPEFLAHVFLFGVLGGSLQLMIGSEARRFITLDDVSVVHRMIRWTLLARVLIGGLSAMVTFAFVTSGIVSTEFVNAPLLLSLTFVSGYSLQYFADIVGRVSETDSEGSENGSGPERGDVVPGEQRP
jgi:hypothetical protein